MLADTVLTRAMQLINVVLDILEAFKLGDFLCYVNSEDSLKLK